MTDKPIIELADVRRYFAVRGWRLGKRQVARAVDGVSFTVDRGETVALVGESGSGKTTIARMVLGLDTPTAGSILFQGRDVRRLTGTDLKDYKTRVQAVFQNPWSSMNPRMRVGRVIAEPLGVQQTMTATEQREHVQKLLQAVGLPEDASTRYPNQFSGGQRQRIAIARAVAPNPKLIALDEPVSALDVSVRAQIMNLLKDIQTEHGVSYLMIAHDLATVRFLSHRVLVMYLGKLVETGPAESLFSHSYHPYTRALVDAANPSAGTSDRLVLEGEIPSPITPPPGCAVRSRCWLYKRLGSPEVCGSTAPLLREVGPGHNSACHFAEELNSETAGTVPLTETKGKTLLTGVASNG